ncbi:MAG: UbiD family decarboxylase [Chloroflexi bacterium]|nr:UbiD family decarboxylase [Chloroflexota bacterium]
MLISTAQTEIQESERQTMDLRSFLAAYRAAYPDDVLDVHRQMKAEYECSAIGKHFENRAQYPLVVFHNVVTTNGRISQFPLALNVTGDRRKLAFAIGSTFEDVAIDWRRRLSDARHQPVVISRGDAPVKQNVLVGDKVDLLDLPAMRIHEMDPGAYITGGMLTTHEPKTWIDNCAQQRGFIAGPREIRCYVGSHSHNYRNLLAHSALGKEMKVAYWIGHHPAVFMGAHSGLGYPESHYVAASAVMGQPLRLVSSETLGEDFLVPADAEFVIEGIMVPGKRALEAPFGEYPRYYGPQRLSEVFDVTALSYRDGAIWDQYLVGTNNNYSGTHEEANIYAAVKRAVPEVQRVYCPVSGSGRFHAYIQLKKTHEGQPREAIMAALSASFLIKHVIVVDDDIDVYDDRWVLWAVATRSQWDRDVVVVPNCFGPNLDPTTREGGVGTKGGIDATKPAPPRRFPLQVNVPKDVMERVTLEEYVDSSALARVPDQRDRKPGLRGRQ